jgi:probable blue pigment (indigoidine) exporter
MPESQPGYGRVEIALLLLVSVAWGSAYILIREGLTLGAAPIAFAGARYLLSAVAFGAFAALRRAPRPSRRALLVSASVGGLLIIGLYGGLLYWGEQYTTGGYAAVLASTAPILTVVIGYPILAGERLGPRSLLGVSIGFVGAAVLVLPELWGSPLGSWQGPVFILAAMTSVATGTVLLRRYGGGPQGLWQISGQFTVAGLLLGVAAVAIPGGDALPLTGGVLESLAILVALSSVVGYFAYFALHHRVGPVRANVVAYLAPVVGVGLGTLLLGEPVTFWEIGGVAVVLSGVSLILWERVGAAPATATPGGPSRG